MAREMQYDMMYKVSKHILWKRKCVNNQVNEDVEEKAKNKK